MNLFNMTNRAQIHEFYKKVKQRKFLSFEPEFQMLWFSRGITVNNNAKFQHNISKIMAAMSNKLWDMGCEYHYSR